MKKIIVTLLVALASTLHIAAQEVKPVQFNFTSYRDADGQAYISIKAKLAQGVGLFSIKKNKPDAFATTVVFDSTIQQKTTDALLEKAARSTVADSAVLLMDSVEWKQQIAIHKNDSAVIKGSVSWLGFKADTKEYPSGEESFAIEVKALKEKPIASKDDLSSKSLWSIFWLCFGVGIAAIFSPCVFPLIPVTVSFFLKQSKTKAKGVTNSLWYSISIILIYVIPTLILTRIFGEKIMYEISTHPFTNILFFVLFIVFGISLLGAFELTLPSKWANKADQNAGTNFKGIFFMALTLVIVSFSCTGPLVGLLLGKTSQQGSILAPVLGMAGFGAGLALPFALFALFPSFMQSLPKSGGWLNSVKVVFGFIELALAMKFLSNVDLIYHWHLLNRDVFLVIWIVLFYLMGSYLLGKLKFSHDSDLKFISLPRLFFAIASFSFAVYLVPGLWGAPLQPLSGLIPPATTQDFNLHELKYKFANNTTATPGSNTTAVAQPPKKYIDKLHVPYGLVAYFDLEEGMAAAKALNKPVMLDFTGHSCANCRKMEEQVWEKPEVLKRLKQDFVLISLYVDESTELPMAEQYTNSSGEKITTVGERNLDYEITKFGFNAQPLYMFLDLQGNPLSDIKYGYDADVMKFINHLDTVKKAFDQKK
jgi:thiol:disulfide interchange protein DsbD